MVHRTLCALTAAGAFALAVFLVAARAYPDAPPPAHTGGFGEPTCRRCHFDAPMNPLGGALEVRGLPGGYAPGAAYPIEISLVDSALQKAGFQLAARFADGRQAGRLSVDAAKAGAPPGVAVVASGGVLYAAHTRAGTAPEAAGRASWRLTWTAPDTAGAVVLHVVANAADGDASELGDRLYARVDSSAGDERE